LSHHRQPPDHDRLQMRGHAIADEGGGQWHYEPGRRTEGPCASAAANVWLMPMRVATLPRSPLGLVLAGLALTALFLSGSEPPHAHGDGIYNAECTVSALVALGSSVALVELTAVVVVVAPLVAEALISGDPATPRISGCSVGCRAPPRV
jgi:hypothetical protein